MPPTRRRDASCTRAAAPRCRAPPAPPASRACASRTPASRVRRRRRPPRSPSVRLTASCARAASDAACAASSCWRETICLSASSCTRARSASAFTRVGPRRDDLRVERRRAGSWRSHLRLGLTRDAAARQRRTRGGEVGVGLREPHRVLALVDAHERGVRPHAVVLARRSPRSRSHRPSRAPARCGRRPARCRCSRASGRTATASAPSRMPSTAREHDENEDDAPARRPVRDAATGGADVRGALLCG